MKYAKSGATQRKFATAAAARDDIKSYLDWQDLLKPIQCSSSCANSENSEQKIIYLNISDTN